MMKAIKTFRNVWAAVMILGLFGSLCPAMPSATSIIVSRRWSRTKVVALIGYRLVTVAFGIWIGWM